MGLANFIPFRVKVSMEVLPFKNDRAAALSPTILANEEIAISLFITFIFIIRNY